MKSYGLAEWVRITVGTPEQLSKLLEAFPSILLPLRTLKKK